MKAMGFSRWFGAVALVALASAFAQQGAAQAGGLGSAGFWYGDAGREAGGGSGIGLGGGAAGTFRLAADVGISRMSLDGEIEVVRVGIGTGRWDFKDDLNVEDDTQNRFGALLQLGILRLGGSYQKLDFEGEVEDLASFEIFGVTFSGDSVRTRVFGDYIRGELGFVIPIVGDVFEIGLGVGAHYLDLTYEFTGTASATDGEGNTITTTETATDSVAAPIPVGMVHASIFLGSFLSIEPQVQYLYIPRVQRVKGSALEANVLVRWYPIANVSLGVRAGYTRLFADIERDDEDSSDDFAGTFDMNGFQIGGVIGISF